MLMQTITSVVASESYSDHTFPAVRVHVTTSGGAEGVSSYTQGVSYSSFSAPHLYDGDSRFQGKSVTKAVRVINTVLAPTLVGMTVTDQLKIDDVILKTLAEHSIEPATNITSPVSSAVLKAGAASLNLPLYRYVGGESAFTVPCPAFLCASGSNRYRTADQANGNPNYAFLAHGFDNYDDATYAVWEVETAWENAIAAEYGVRPHHGFSMAIPAGRVDSDRQLFDLMVKVIDSKGYTGKVGIFCDISATPFYNRERGVYEGLFDSQSRTPEQLIAYYQDLVKKYPIIALQDPLECGDLTGSAALAASLGIDVIAADLFDTDLPQLRKCLQTGCMTTALLRVEKFPTVTQCIQAVHLCSEYGVKICPCDSVGEDVCVADYAVGYHAASAYMVGLCNFGNELALLSSEIGPNARFMKSGENI